MTEHREVAVEVTIAAPIETVWRALRDRDDLRRWHGWDDPTLDEEIEVIYFAESREQDPGGPDRQLVCGGSVFELTDQGQSTVVRVVMAEPPESDAWHGWYEDIRHGWHTFVQQLRFFVERHPGQDRRTVFLAGAPADPDQPELPALLGLDGVGGADAPYAAGLPTGDEVAGRVWFRAGDQLGVTVDSWHDGLLVVTDRRNPAMVVLSTYGLDDDAFAALEQRWRGWWGKHFEEPGPTS
jgi:hypothetical protein